MMNVKNLMKVFGLASLLLVGCESQGNEVVQEQEVQEQQVEVQEVQEQQVEVQEVQEQQVEVQEQEVFGLNDRITVEYGSGTVEIVFTNAYFTDYRNSFEENQPDNVLVVEYEYTNVDYEDIFDDEYLLMYGFDYQIYGQDNFTLDTYPHYTLNNQPVSIGRSSVGSDSFHVNGEQTHFEIELHDGQLVVIELE